MPYLIPTDEHTDQDTHGIEKVRVSSKSISGREFENGGGCISKTINVDLGRLTSLLRDNWRPYRDLEDGPSSAKDCTEILLVFT